MPALPPAWKALPRELRIVATGDLLGERCEKGDLQSRRVVKTYPRTVRSGDGALRASNQSRSGSSTARLVAIRFAEDIRLVRQWSCSRSGRKATRTAPAQKSPVSRHEPRDHGSDEFGRLKGGVLCFRPEHLAVGNQVAMNVRW